MPSSSTMFTYSESGRTAQGYSFESMTSASDTTNVPAQGCYKTKFGQKSQHGQYGVKCSLNPKVDAVTKVTVSMYIEGGGVFTKDICLAFCKANSNYNYSNYSAYRPTIHTFDSCYNISVTMEWTSPEDIEKFMNELRRAESQNGYIYFSFFNGETKLESGYSYSHEYCRFENFRVTLEYTENNIVKYWDSGQWVKCKPHYHDGTGWKECQVYYYDGEWKPCGI